MARLSLANIRESINTMIASSPQISTADLNNIIKHTHRAMATAFQWSYRKRDKVIQTVAPYSTGTVTVTAGSSTVTGAGTVWTAGMAGRQIRIAGENTFFWVVSVDAALQTLVLGDGTLTAVNWVAAGGALKTYSIFQDQFAVPSDVAVILYSVRDWPMAESSEGEIDGQDPQRTSTGIPDRWYWARANIASQVESRFVGLWQVPNAAMTFRMPYLIEPQDMTAEGDLPVCPSEVLELAAGARACAFLHARTGDERWSRQFLALQQALMGTPQLLGVLQQALQDDSHRFGLPSSLQGTGTVVGYDRLASRDWAAME